MYNNENIVLKKNTSGITVKSFTPELIAKMLTLGFIPEMEPTSRDFDEQNSFRLEICREGTNVIASATILGIRTDGEMAIDSFGEGFETYVKDNAFVLDLLANPEFLVRQLKGNPHFLGDYAVMRSTCNATNTYIFRN